MRVFLPFPSLFALLEQSYFASTSDALMICITFVLESCWIALYSLLFSESSSSLELFNLALFLPRSVWLSVQLISDYLPFLKLPSHSELLLFYKICSFSLVFRSALDFPCSSDLFFFSRVMILLPEPLTRVSFQTKSFALRSGDYSWLFICFSECC